jgi:hypothetical protein
MIIVYVTSLNKDNDNGVLRKLHGATVNKITRPAFMWFPISAC